MMVIKLMKIQKIQTQNYYKSNNISVVNSQKNNQTFQALRLKSSSVKVKTNTSPIMKIGAMATAAVVSMKGLFFNKMLEVSTVGQIKQDAISLGESLAENVYLNDGKFNQKEI